MIVLRCIKPQCPFRHKIVFNSLLTAWGMSGAPSGAFLDHYLGHVWGMSGTTSGAYCQQWTKMGNNPWCYMHLRSCDDVFIMFKLKFFQENDFYLKLVGPQEFGSSSEPELSQVWLTWLSFA